MQINDLGKLVTCHRQLSPRIHMIVVVTFMYRLDFIVIGSILYIIWVPLS